MLTRICRQESLSHALLTSSGCAAPMLLSLTSPSRASVLVIEHPSFGSRSVPPFLHGRHLGGRERAARELQALLKKTFSCSRVK